MLIVVWMIVIIGCKGLGELGKKKESGPAEGTYWTQGCMVSGSEMLGVLGDEAALVDLKTGNTVKRVNSSYDHLACFPNGDVVALDRGRKPEAVWLNREARFGRASDWSAVGPTADGRLVVYYRDEDRSESKYRTSYDGPLQVAIESLGESRRVTESFKLPPDLFPGLGRGSVSSFITKPVRVLDNGKLLVVAGFRPSVSSDNYVSPTAWGFFLVDPERRTVVSHGPVRISDNDVNLDSDYRWAATADGRLVAGGFTKSNKVVVAVMRATDAREVFRVQLVNSQEIQQVRLSRDGTLLAAGVNVEEGKGGRVDVFDVKTGRLLWWEPTNQLPYILEFLEDDSLVLLTDKRTIARRNVKGD
jgi:hypothetical protein